LLKWVGIGLVFGALFGPFKQTANEIFGWKDKVPGLGTNLLQWGAWGVVMGIVNWRWPGLFETKPKPKSGSSKPKTKLGASEKSGPKPKPSKRSR
jgi:hypothetical protein